VRWLPLLPVTGRHAQEGRAGRTRKQVSPTVCTLQQGVHPLMGRVDEVSQRIEQSVVDVVHALPTVAHLDPLRTILFALVAVLAVILGCMTAGVTLTEALPHRFAEAPPLGQLVSSVFHPAAISPDPGETQVHPATLPSGCDTIQPGIGSEKGNERGIVVKTIVTLTE